MDADLAIKLEHVSKSFKLPHEKNTSIKSAVLNFYKRRKSYEKQRVLKDISFEINKGEFFGIVGRNGSGKSTLLKMLAGIYSPSEGNIDIRGQLTPFIELGVGFNPELTGRENVFLNGALLGFNRKDMDLLYDDIVEFAELRRFMDQKLKNYSSGMQVRLAFSIAIRAKSDILLIDEVLAVGDADFQRKCLQYFTALKREKQTVVFVSHDMESIKKYCDRVAYIEKGDLKLIGSPQTVVPEFMSSFVEHSDDEAGGYSNKKRSALPLGLSSAISTDRSMLEIDKVWLEDSSGKQISAVDDSIKEYFVNFVIEAKSDVEGVIPGVIITNNLGEFVVAVNSKWVGYTLPTDVTGKKKYLIKFKMQNIYEQGDYDVSVNVVSKEFDTFYAWKNEVCSLYVEKPFVTGAKVSPQAEMEISEL